MKFKKLIGGLLLSTVLAAGVGVSLSSNKPAIETKADLSKTVTRVYVEDQVTASQSKEPVTVLSIESISFASGYGHSQWRDFLTDYLGTRSTYSTSGGSAQPKAKGWSYMSSTETEKYLLCPSGGKNFTMIFPEWVTAFSYKAVGNSWYDWFDVGGSAVGVHSTWGFGKKVESYIYDQSGWKMNADVVNTAQTNSWGDVTLTARAIKDGTTTQVDSQSITMAKYYIPASQTYPSIFGYNISGWYTSNALTTEYTSIITSNATAYVRATPKTESYLAGSMNGWNTTDPNYLMEPTENSQYRISKTFEAGVELKVIYQGNWIGWDQVDLTSKVVTNGSVAKPDNNDNIKIVTAGSYEIYFKTGESSNRIWIQQDSTTEATTYATAFLAAITCTQTSTTFNINVWNEVSGTSSMEYKYNDLDKGARDILTEATPNQGGSVIEQCVARYDRILSKYGYGTASGQYHDFMGRKPSKSNSGATLISTVINGSTGSMIAIITISAVSLAAVGGYFLFKKKKD